MSVRAEPLMPVLTPAAVDEIAATLPDATAKRLRRTVAGTVRTIIAPLLRGDGVDTEVEIEAAVIAYAPRRAEAIATILRGLDSRAAPSFLRECADSALRLLLTEGGRLGPGRDAFARGLEIYRTLIADFLRRWRTSTQQPPPPSDRIPTLLLVATRVDLCLTSLACHLEGTVTGADAVRVESLCDEFLRGTERLRRELSGLFDPGDASAVRRSRLHALAGAVTDSTRLRRSLGAVYAARRGPTGRVG